MAGDVITNGDAYWLVVSGLSLEPLYQFSGTSNSCLSLLFIGRKEEESFGGLEHISYINSLSSVWVAGKIQFKV